MKYRYLLIDNDNTLMDFHAAEHAALRETLAEAGIEPTDAVCARYSAINDTLEGTRTRRNHPRGA